MSGAPMRHNVQPERRLLAHVHADVLDVAVVVENDFRHLR